MINLHAEVLKVSFNITLTSIEARWLGGHDIQSDQNQPQIVCQEAGLIKKLYSIEVCEDQTLDFLCGCILCSLLIIFVHLMIHKNSNLDDSFLREAFKKKNRIFHDIEQNSFATYPPYLIMT